MESKVNFKPNPEYRLMDQVREVSRYYHFAYRTEQSYGNMGVASQILSIFLLIRSSRPLSFRSVSSFFAIRSCRAAIPAPEISNRRPIDPVSFHRLAGIFQELFAVPNAPVYIHSRVSAIHHVIEGTREFYS
jgi:hypothetical protein